MPRLLLFLMMLALAGCSLGNLPTPRATYVPIPDARLYARISMLPGVASANLRWTNGFDNPNGYGGEVRAREGAEVVQILDHVLAILRQGRPGADLGGIEVVPIDDFVIGPTDFGLATQADYTARYGPQPGSGLPPPTPLVRTR